MCLRSMAQFVGGETRYRLIIQIFLSYKFHIKNIKNFCILLSSWNIFKNGLEIYRFEGIQGFFKYNNFFKMSVTLPLIFINF